MSLRRVTIFGGYTSAGATEEDHYLNDTWYWTSGPNGSWVRETPESILLGRAYYSSAYYGSRAFVLMQNGEAASTRPGSIVPLDRAHLWTGVDRPEQPVFQFPCRVRAGAMAYDGAHDRMIYFGGLAFLPDDQSIIYDGTWSLEDKR